MALINWNWTSPDMAAKAVSDVNDAANANYKEQQKRNTDAAFARNLDAKGNLTGGQWADIARMGGSPEEAARFMAYRGNQSDTMAKLAQNAYTSYINGGNPHAGDSDTIQNVLPNVQQTQTQQPGTSDSSTGLGGVLSNIGRGIKGLFTSQEPTSQSYTLLTPDDVYPSNVAMPVYDKSTDTASVLQPSYLDNDKTGFVTADMRDKDGIHPSTGAFGQASGDSSSSSFKGNDPAFNTSFVSPLVPEKAPDIPIQSAPAQTVQAPPAPAPAPQGTAQAGKGDFLNEYWAQVHPELAMDRMTGTGDQAKDKPSALTLPKISIDTMSPSDKIAAAKMLTSKGLLNTDQGKYTDGDLQTALGNYVSQLQAGAGPAPQLGHTQSVSITPGKPPTITTSTDTASYNKQMQDWYKAQMEIVPQVRKELGDSFAQVYQQEIDRKKLGMEIIKFDNDVKQNNTTREGMDQLALATSNVLDMGKGKKIDSRTFQDANALEAFGKQADAYIMLKKSGAPGNIAEVIAQAKNYSVAEGVPPTEGMLKVLMMMGADPSQLMQIKLYDGNGNLESAAISMAQGLLAKGLGGRISGSAMTENMAFKKEIDRHTGKGTMGSLTNIDKTLPADNTPGGPVDGAAGAASGTTPPPPAGATTPPGGGDNPPTPKGSWFNTPGSTPKDNHFVGTNINPVSGAGNDYFVTARDAAGNATEAQDLQLKKYKIVDAGQGVHIIPMAAPATPSRSKSTGRSTGAHKPKVPGAGSKTQTAADRLKAKFGQK